MTDDISQEGHLLTTILRTTYHGGSIQFFTPSIFSQQLAYMNHPQGYVITPHLHNAVPREMQFTKDVLFVKLGKVRVDFYDDDQQYLDILPEALVTSALSVSTPTRISPLVKAG